MVTKNTVTILGVILCLVILYIGYNYRINSKTELVAVPVAKQTIQPRTYITEDMIEIRNVPVELLNTSKYYTTSKSIVGKYSNYNTMIAKGSLFYTDLVVEEKRFTRFSLFRSTRRIYSNKLSCYNS